MNVLKHSFSPFCKFAWIAGKLIYVNKVCYSIFPIQNDQNRICCWFTSEHKIIRINCDLWVVIMKALLMTLFCFKYNETSIILRFAKHIPIENAYYRMYHPFTRTYQEFRFRSMYCWQLFEVNFNNVIIFQTKLNSYILQMFTVS